MFLISIQVLGDHRKADGMYDLALLFYEVSSRNKEAFKLNEEKWWYVSVTDVRAHIKDPVEEKVSGSRKLYYLRISVFML